MPCINGHQLHNPQKKKWSVNFVLFFWEKYVVHQVLFDSIFLIISVSYGEKSRKKMRKLKGIFFVFITLSGNTKCFKSTAFKWLPISCIGSRRRNKLRWRTEEKITNRRRENGFSFFFFFFFFFFSGDFLCVCVSQREERMKSIRVVVDENKWLDPSSPLVFKLSASPWLAVRLLLLLLLTAALRMSTRDKRKRNSSHSSYATSLVAIIPHLSSRPKLPHVFFFVSGITNFPPCHFLSPFSFLPFISFEKLSMSNNQ